MDCDGRDECSWWANVDVFVLILIVLLYHAVCVQSYFKTRLSLTLDSQTILLVFLGTIFSSPQSCKLKELGCLCVCVCLGGSIDKSHKFSLCSLCCELLTLKRYGR